MIRYKRLNVPKYIKREPKVIPLKYIGRDGWYFDRNLGVSWCEFEGYFYYMDLELFKYTLQLLNVNELNKRQINALKIINQEKLASNKQRQLYSYYKDSKDFHRMDLNYLRLLSKL